MTLFVFVRYECGFLVSLKANSKEENPVIHNIAILTREHLMKLVKPPGKVSFRDPLPPILAV
jgi:hypothetical protein